MPSRPAEGHKGTFGHVFVVAGSTGFTGAAKLAALAAARSGVGLVTVGVPESVASIVAADMWECMTRPLPAADSGGLARSAVKPALRFANDKDAVAIGPGLGQHSETTALVENFLKDVHIPTVVDADALNALAAAGQTALLEGSIATPHPGELARLTGKTTNEIQANRAVVASAFAKDQGCILLLKGHRSIVADPSGQVYENPTGNAGMATGGSGDVLTGILGGLLAQGMKLVECALLGVYVHGLAGDIAAQRVTERALIARDIIDALPEAWRQLEGS
jgi:NAD(P)H-hydrate epimerase